MSDIPQSDALKEATIDSLTEVMSRDPEGLSRQDRDRVVEALRAQRARLASAAASGEGKKSKAPAGGGPKALLSSVSSAKAEDLGL